MNKRNSPADMFSRLSQVPFGADLFSRAVVFKAPYFATISPKFLELEPGRCEIFMKKRRRVTNHIGTVHAIAMCNLCELAAGTMIESTLPGNLRWIPRGMSARYLKKAETSVTARTEMAPVADGFKGDIVVPVKVYDTNDQVVMEADINMYVSPRKAAAS
jgi:acyl-coenzyme A thioesterase PaaI-like protein